MTDYPEHEKLKALNGANETVGDFITWLRESGMEICDHDEHWDGDLTYNPVFKPIEKLIAEFFDIDQAALESEKRQMLDEMRAAQSA